MAIIIGEPLIGSISGSIGGVNFYNFRGRQCVRMKPIPPKPHTPKQAESIARYRVALHDWQSQNYSKDKQLYEDWGKSSVFSSRGMKYPLTAHQFFLGYRTNVDLSLALPPEPDEQPAERPKCPVVYPYYIPHLDAIWVWFDGYGIAGDRLFLWYTDHNYTQNNVLPRKYKHFRESFAWWDMGNVLVAQYTMDDDAVTPEVLDRSGNDYSFVFFDPIGNANTDWHSRVGKCNKALDFDGGDDYAKRDYHADFNFDGEHSFSAWIYADTIGPGSRWIFACYHPADGAGTGLNFLIISAGRLSLRTYDGADDEDYYDDRILEENTWYHVGYTLNEDGDLYFYVDGVPSEVIHTTGLPPAPTGETMYLGAETAGHGFFDGRIDDVRFYNRAFHSGLIYAIYNFSPEHTHMEPIVDLTEAEYIAGNHQTWFKYRYISQGGGWSPLHKTHFRHTF